MNKALVRGNGKIGILIIVATISLLGLGAYFLTKPQPAAEIPPRDISAYEYFWGNGCPHCAKVQDFFNTWDKKDVVKVTKYEVWYDKNNSAIMQDRFNNCDPKPGGQMAVPFMVTPDGKCLVGDTPIIDLFKSL